MRSAGGPGSLRAESACGFRPPARGRGVDRQAGGRDDVGLGGEQLDLEPRVDHLGHRDRLSRVVSASANGKTEDADMHRTSPPRQNRGCRLRRAAYHGRRAMTEHVGDRLAACGTAAQ